MSARTWLGRAPPVAAPQAARPASVDVERAWAAPRTLWLLWIRRAHRLLPVPACPRNSRVGANSPSLWPTIDSVTNTGTCLRPSCTAIVWPTISGKIVEVRDQVLSIRLSPEEFITSTRAIRRSSTNGPFLLDRLIASYLFCVLGRCSGQTPCA